MNFIKSLLKRFKRERITVERVSYYESSRIMTVTYSDGSQNKYKGDCTIWHELPMMTRCSIWKEAELCSYWQYIKTHGNDYPTAHLNSNP